MEFGVGGARKPAKARRDESDLVASRGVARMPIEARGCWRGGTQRGEVLYEECRDSVAGRGGAGLRQYGVRRRLKVRGCRRDVRCEKAACALPSRANPVRRYGLSQHYYSPVDAAVTDTLRAQFVFDMAKDKQPRTKAKGVPNKHLHARSTFLYQAATYLTLRAGAPDADRAEESAQSSHAPQSYPGLALQLGSDLQNVSRKGQVRLSPELKRTICKTCNTVLIPGRTATQAIENESKGGKKSWADVLVITCALCTSKKRFPIGAKRQRKKSERQPLQAQDLSERSVEERRSTISPIHTTTDQASTSG
jgi:ribonuclease P protein subunit RPR2